MGVSGDPTGPVEGFVLEASLDTAKGYVVIVRIRVHTLYSKTSVICHFFQLPISIMH